jgi:hypothetical protein
MDAPKNGQGGNNQNGNGQNQKKAGQSQLSWSQPVVTPTQTSTSEKKSAAQTTGAAAQQAQANNMFRYVVIAVVILAVIGIIWAIAVSNKKTPAAEQTTADQTQTAPSSTSTEQTSAPANEVGFSVPSPQNAGSEVAITNVEVSVPTWVIVYENRDGQPGNALGAALFWAGKTSGAVDLLRNTTAGQTYLVGEARDNGDRVFTLHKDPSVLDANGIPVWVQFEAK